MIFWEVVVRPDISPTGTHLVVEEAVRYGSYYQLRCVNGTIISIGGVLWENIPGVYRNTIGRWVLIQPCYTLDNFHLVYV